jgi:glycine/D-amino acid oxidase-like deaminating enzyme
VAYYLIRTGDGGASVTVCRDRAGTEESTRRAADWIRQSLAAVAGSPPEVAEGEVIIQFS